MEPASVSSAKSVEFRPLPPQQGAEAPNNADAQAVSKVVRAPIEPVKLGEHTEEMRQAAEQAAQDIQHSISSMARQVRVEKDGLTGYIRVQIVDPASGEVIRTLPSDELLRIARSFEMLGSVMVNQRA